ncbi:MAG TPA: NFACT family protein [bacterium]|nr:NFACT family protein [bacterium]
MGEPRSLPAMTHAELARVVATLAAKLTGAPVQKVRQVRADAVTLECRAPGETIHLLFSVHPRFFRVLPQADKPAGEAATSAFAMLLRKRLIGGRIVELALEPRDRIVSLAVNRRDEDGNDEVWTLLAELFGPKSNLLLLAPDGKIVDALQPRRLASRELAVGELYRLPDDSPPPATDDRGLAIEEMARLRNEAEAADERSATLRTTSGAVNRERKRLRKYLVKLREESAAQPDAERLTWEAQTILAYLHQVRRGMAKVELPDLNDPQRTVTVELDPARSPQDNADRKFKLARRTRRKVEALSERLTEMQTKHDALEEIAAALAREPADEELAALVERVRSLGVKMPAPQAAPVRKKKQEEQGGVRPFTAQDGAKIYVGRNDRENDELTFRLARGNDYWLHVEGAPGSHVVVRLPAGGELTSETLLDAASLALLHSSRKSAGDGTVMYTRRKHIRKPKGAPPGKVLAGSTKSIFIRLDDERVERLYQSRE